MSDETQLTSETLDELEKYQREAQEYGRRETMGWISPTLAFAGLAFDGGLVAQARRALTLEAAINDALDSAADEGADKYRGTDEPREWVVILREAMGGQANG